MVSSRDCRSGKADKQRSNCSCSKVVVSGDAEVFLVTWVSWRKCASYGGSNSLASTVHSRPDMWADVLAALQPELVPDQTTKPDQTTGPGHTTNFPAKLQVLSKLPAPAKLRAPTKTQAALQPKPPSDHVVRSDQTISPIKLCVLAKLQAVVQPELCSDQTVSS